MNYCLAGTIKHTLNIKTHRLKGLKMIVHINTVPKITKVAILILDKYYRTENFIYLLRVTYLTVFYPRFKS